MAKTVDDTNSDFAFLSFNLMRMKFDISKAVQQFKTLITSLSVLPKQTLKRAPICDTNQIFTLLVVFGVFLLFKSEHPVRTRVTPKVMHHIFFLKIQFLFYNFAIHTVDRYSL
jgi:hypothetical protein